MEQWKDIPGYEGRYQASDQGNIRSMPRQTSGVRMGTTCSINLAGKVLKPHYRGREGRKYVVITIDRTSYSVHRLVLMAFKGMPSKGEIARHLNDDHTDNRLVNLAWGTQGDNHRDAVVNGRWTPQQGKDHGCAKLTDAQVLEMRAKKAQGATVAALGAEYNLTPSQAARVCNGEAWGHLPGAVTSKPGNTRFTDEQREEIIRLFRSGVPGPEVARRFGCTRSYVTKLAKRA